MNHEAGHFGGSDHGCHDHASDQFMINALMLQHQHHEQLTGGYHIGCNYPPTAPAGAVAAQPSFQSLVDHHPFGPHVGTVSGSLAPAFPAMGGSHLVPLAGNLPAGSSPTGSSMLTYGSIPPRIISASGNGMPPSQNGGASGSGCGSSVPARGSPAPPSRYESQKRRDWNTFGHYLKNSTPPLAVTRCNGDHVLQFLRYLDQFGKTKVHAQRCPYFGLPHPPGPCDCPFRQAWGSLDALIGRLRAAFEEHGGKPESNPFGARQVRLYLREVRELQAKARGIAYEKKKRKRPKPPAGTNCASSSDSNTDFHSDPPAGSSSSSGFALSGCNEHSGRRGSGPADIASSM